MRTNKKENGNCNGFLNTKLVFAFSFFILLPILTVHHEVNESWREYRPLSRGGQVESQGNKKLCFCTASIALNLRLAEAWRAKTKLFISPRLNVAVE